MRRLVQSKEYRTLKKLAKNIASTYRTVPGNSRSEDESYLTHCKVVWAYSTLFSKVEQIAQLEERREEKDEHDGW